MSPPPEIRLHRVGDATVTKIPELALDGAAPENLYPDCDPAAIPEAANGIGAGSRDPATGLLRQSTHSWLVRTPTQVILVDTATGNDKDRPASPIFNHLDQPYLERLKTAGVAPEDVDLVLITHLHADHVGWNTRRIAGRWVPTFPNARYLFSGLERAYCAALAAGDGSDATIREQANLGPMRRLPMPGVFEDSVQPVIDAGLAKEIAVDGSEVADGFAFHPLPGHSIDHAAISFVSNGERALFCGDTLHHPMQVARPDWNSAYCEFPEAARRSRRRAMDDAAATGALVFTTHFAESSAGRLTRAGDRFHWQFV